MTDRAGFSNGWTTVLGSALLVLVGVTLGSAAEPQPKRPAAPPAPKVKGIWEPVNYQRDVTLTSVYFVNGQAGWVTTANGVILHTTDAGDSWEVQAGDPDSEGATITDLRFLDATHGWATTPAVQETAKLYRTLDGRTWEQFGEIPHRWQYTYTDYVFTSVNRGIAVLGPYLLTTADGGRTWKDTAECKVNAQVQGLTREVKCSFVDLSFPTPAVGYASVKWDSSEHPNDDAMALAETKDGGSTWTISALPDLVGAGLLIDVSSVAFTDEDHGVLRLRGGKAYVTADAGKTWRGLLGPLGREFAFADPEVGLAMNGWDEVTMQVTADGGRSWATRTIKFPAHFVAASLPLRDRAFAIGEHGMIYRYRVVPESYTAPNTVGALLLPAYGELLRADLERARSRVQAIEAQVAGLPAPTPGTAGAAARAAAPIDDAAETESDFTQDVSLTEEALAVPSSPLIDGCCGSQLGQLQSDLVAIGLQMPTFAGRFRNANLLFTGMNLVADLISRSHRIRESFVALRQAPDAPAAAAALQDLSAAIESTSQAVSSGFADLTTSDAAAVAPKARAAAAAGALAAKAPSAGGAAAAGTVRKKLKDKLKGLNPF